MLKYMPIYGSILLTIIIVWIVASTVVGNRRKIRDAVAGRYIRSDCCGATTTPRGWTADGWVSVCDACGRWQFLGDDFDNPPPGFAERHDETVRAYAAELHISADPNSRLPLPAPAESATHSQSDEAKSADVRGILSTEVTSGCELCGGELEHEADCPRGILIDMMPDQVQPVMTPDDFPPQPNMGGEGHPDYQGPHYAVDHDQFVPYDVLRDPPEGAAVHIVGNVACVGPFPAEGDRGNADPSREEDES